MRDGASATYWLRHRVSVANLPTTEAATLTEIVRLPMFVIIGTLAPDDDCSLINQLGRAASRSPSTLRPGSEAIACCVPRAAIGQYSGSWS